MAGISMDGVANLSPEFQRAFQMAAQAERKPIEKIEMRKSVVEEKLRLVNDVLGKVDGVRKLLPNLNSPIAIRELAVNTDDPKVISGTADKSIAAPGKYSLEVLRLAKSASAVSNGFEDKDSTTVGIGYVTFQTQSGESREIFVDAENGTLEGIAKVINSARVGMKAAVINDPTFDEDAPYRLLLTAEGQGANANVEYPQFYFVDGEEDFYIDEERPALNALLRYEGFEMESPSNEMKDLIPGVALSLKGITDPGRPNTISVEQDVPKTKVKVKDLVDNLNQVFTFIQNQNTIDENSDTSKSLAGDYGIRVAEDRLKSALQQRYYYDDSRPIRGLPDIGIELTKNGLLTLDEKKLENALTANFDSVVQMLSGDGAGSGVIPKLSAAISSIATPGAGILTNQKKTFSEQANRYKKEIETKEKTAEAKTTALKGKLARAQAALSQMSGQANYVQSSLGGSGDLAQTLLAR